MKIIKNFLWQLSVLAICLYIGPATAQHSALPGSIDESFAPVVSGRVTSIALQGGGKILVGGHTVNPSSKNGLVRLNEDGSIDETFDPPILPFTEDFGYGGIVWTLLSEPGDEVLVGGRFRTRDQKSEAGLIGLTRLHFDGSLDSSFVASAAPDVIALKLQPNRKILVGQFGSQLDSHFRRLNANGTPDAEFNVKAAVNDTVAAIDLQPDGKVVIGGKFTLVNGAGRTGIARLHPDGSLDTNFNPVIEGQMRFPKGDIIFDPDYNFGVLAILIQPDRKILIAGAFQKVNGTQRNGIARLNSDGSLDTNFVVGAGVNARVFSLARQADGQVLLGGVFTKVDIVERKRLARLNVNGSLDLTFNPGLGSGWNAVSALMTQNKQLLIGGAYDPQPNDRHGAVLRLNSSTSHRPP